VWHASQCQTWPPRATTARHSCFVLREKGEQVRNVFGGSSAAPAWLSVQAAENRRDIETILRFSYLNCGKNTAQCVFRLIG
jgi:hypothetical protein